MGHLHDIAGVDGIISSPEMEADQPLGDEEAAATSLRARGVLM